MNLIVVNESKLRRDSVLPKLPLITATVGGRRGSCCFSSKHILWGGGRGQRGTGRRWQTCGVKRAQMGRVAGVMTSLLSSCRPSCTAVDPAVQRRRPAGSHREGHHGWVAVQAASLLFLYRLGAADSVGLCTHMPCYGRRAVAASAAYLLPTCCLPAACHLDACVYLYCMYRLHVLQSTLAPTPMWTRPLLPAACWLTSLPRGRSWRCGWACRVGERRGRLAG